MKIALGFSGGGFRASAFSLGLLSYLNKLTLLKNISVLSTVSGGTITGARFTTGMKKGECFIDIYESLYAFMRDVKLVDFGLERLANAKHWNSGRIHSLINALADVYDEQLFGRDKFGILFSEETDTLSHMSFNATEFSHALQFRFQWSEKVSQPQKDEPERGIIGNHYHRIPEKIAAEVRMGDIVAASSCFPGGFEPINFPTDFVFPSNLNVTDELGTPLYPVGLMDGGIVDNQGIEPILLAESRMKRNRAIDKPLEPQDGNVLDLIILSDVSSPYMEKYSVSHQKARNWWRMLTPAVIFSLNGILFLLSFSFLVMELYWKNVYLAALLSCLCTIEIGIFLLSKVLRSLPQKLHVPMSFNKPLKNLLKLKLAVYESLILNRSNSVLKMINDVFLKHVRRLNYQKIYHDPSWKNRVIMSAIYELKAGEAKLAEKFSKYSIPEEFKPSTLIHETAKKASDMGTTLWFTQKELQADQLLDVVIACGQFSICWNLLEYIYRIKADNSNTGAAHNQILALEAEIVDHWRRFNVDPFWMVRGDGKSNV